MNIEHCLLGNYQKNHELFLSNIFKTEQKKMELKNCGEKNGK